MDLRTPCALCFWRSCSCGREQRAAEREWFDRMAERNERAARIAKLRKPARPTLRYAAVLTCAALIVVAAFVRFVVMA
jgi:hypothetical protein